MKISILLGLGGVGFVAGLIALQRPAAPSDQPPWAGASEKSCVGCHAERQPGVMVQYFESAHARENVSCEECHGDDHDRMFRDHGKVPSAICQGCHAEETLEFKQSVHGKSRKHALKNARLMAQIPAMQRQGCMGCHDMGGRRGGRCNDCHGAHRFSVEEARRPESCGLCHRGPDHPHIEMYEASKHGIAYLASGEDERIAPNCVTCHMPNGTHDVSHGITIGRAGSGSVLEGTEPPIPMKTIAADVALEERAKMLKICGECHTPRTARQALDDADAIKREADRLVGEAKRIVTGLHRDGLLDPAPEHRLPHPTKGHALVLGGPMLYENQSDAERIFFDLAKFAHAITFKGAYHHSPDHTHWLGMARLKASIVELRAEDRRLRKPLQRSD